MTTITVPYSSFSLGASVDQVWRSFLKHPGIGDKKPFGFDVYQGFEFFLGVDSHLYRKIPGAIVPLSLHEEAEIQRNIAEGGVEFYLTRPTAGIIPIKTEKVILHAATGRSLPVSL